MAYIYKQFTYCNIYAVYILHNMYNLLYIFIYVNKVLRLMLVTVAVRLFRYFLLLITGVHL